MAGGTVSLQPADGGISKVASASRACTRTRFQLTRESPGGGRSASTGAVSRLRPRR
jgi:hypothetical protein